MPEKTIVISINLPTNGSCLTLDKEKLLLNKDFETTQLYFLETEYIREGWEIRLFDTVDGRDRGLHFKANKDNRIIDVMRIMDGEVVRATEKEIRYPHNLIRLYLGGGFDS